MIQGSRLVLSENHREFHKDCHRLHHRDERPSMQDTQESIGLSIRRATFRMLAGREMPQSTGKRVDGRKVRRIALLRYDAIGDYIVSTPLIRWLKAALPHVEVDIISSYRNASLVAADPYIDMHHPISPAFKLLHPSLLSLRSVARERDYDLLFALSTDRMTRAAIVARAVSPGAEKIGLVHDRRQDIYGQVFTRQVAHHRWLEHWGETILRMGTEIIEPVVQPAAVSMQQHIGIRQETWERVEIFLRRHELGHPGFRGGIVPGSGWEGDVPASIPGAPYCVLNISAHCRERQWSPDRCANVCRILLERFPELQLFIAGAPADSADVAAVVDSVGHRRCRRVELPLDEFVAFVAGAEIVISPDTATIHIAATAQAPVVGLYAEKIKACEWYPMGTRFALLISPSEESINLIEPEEIAAAAEMLLDGVVAAHPAEVVSSSMVHRSTISIPTS